MNKRRNRADWNEFEKREANISPRSKFFSHLSVSLLTLVFIFGLFQSDFQSLRGVLIDVLFRVQWSSTPHPAISTVAYNLESSARYQGSHKIPSEEILKIVSTINQDKPLAIALIAPVSEKYYSDAELTEMARIFSQVEHMYLGYTDNESLGKNSPRALFRSANYAPGYVSRDTFSYGADSVTRRAMLSIDGIPTVYNKLATLYKAHHPSEIAYPQNRVEKFGNSTQTFINWQGPAGTYPGFSSMDVVLHRIPTGTFTNKIVLIGSALEANKDADFVFTPFSREPFHTTSIEGAAHSLATLLNNNGLYRSAGWANVLITVAIGLLSVNLILALSPGMGIVFLLGEIGFLFLFGWLGFHYFQCWINLVHPLLILFVSYYLVIPYRLVDEYKKRWHYQEKSEFIAELERLKSNFLSLVSHDLKTPLARIQGNAELALSDSLDQTSEKQKKSLQTIVQTTEGLSNYVENILDLTRVETSKVHLNKSSKDINSVIQDVIKTKAALAQEKNITIQANLEPLFSFKFDVRLIQQVIANLVENAIKYSPHNTTIVIHAKENNSRVEVSVSDQGCGIPSEEQEKIFSKFYRVSNAQSSNEKGTGLGLYLVKYFVELHDGFVSLKSQLGEGSVFTISLPA